MGEKFTSRVGYLIRNFRIASDMTQKELADKCGLNESTIRNYELGNRYPDEATLLNIANNLGVSFYALSDPDVANIFSALHVLFDIEWAYGLRPTMKDGEVSFKFEERLPSVCFYFTHFDSILKVKLIFLCVSHEVNFPLVY